MSYMHISNLIKDQNILLFKEAFAMEKLHGTSSNVRWKDGKVWLSSGGVSADSFAALFDVPKLTETFQKLGHESVIVYGEGYGAKCQGMSATYGKALRFCAFEVRIGDFWLAVPQAEEIVKMLGLEFVHYVKVNTTLEELDTQRLAPSEQAFRNGCAERDKPETFKKREGIVLRPIIEVKTNNGERIICKYKNDEFSERKSKADTEVNPDKLKLIADCEAIAEEFVTEMRLTHVLDSLGNPSDDSKIPEVMKAMIADIEREGKGEIVESREARRAIGAKTVKMYKARIYKPLSK